MKGQLRKLVAGLLLASVGFVGIFSAPVRASGDGLYVRKQFDVSLSAIPLSSAEIVNPLRGLYTTFDANLATLPRAPYLNYKRFTWNTIETSPHQFDFSLIDAEIAKASAVGAKTAFRLMPCVYPPTQASQVNVPSDFPALLAKGYFISYQQSNSSPSLRLYVPDYNDPIYISRAKELIQALALRYNNDQRVAYVEAGLIGTWGEGNYSQMPNPTPSGALPPGFTMATQVIDEFVKDFSGTRIVVPTDPFAIVPTSADGASAQQWHNVLQYALTQHPTVGMFRNSLGDPTVSWFTAPFANQYVIAAGGTQRWKYAPFAAEFFGPGPQKSKSVPPQIVLALTEVPQNHVALVADGALGSKANLSSQDLANLNQVGKSAGYRFQLDRVTGDAEVHVGRDIQVTSYWENVGVTPAYEPWYVLYQLRKVSQGANGNATVGATVWQGASSLDLRRLLPTNGTAVTINDNLKVNSALAPGDYELVVTVTDPFGYYKTPLALATTGRQSDGSYPIAIVQVKPALSN